MKQPRKAASGQFPIRIPIPQIPKKETPAPAKTPEPRTETVSPISSPASTSSVAAANKSVRGIPIAGGRITFSNNPDGSSPKTSFTSSEYIYGRLDLGGKTLYDAFGFKNFRDAQFFYVYYHLRILPAGEEAWEHAWLNSKRAALVTKEDAQKTYFAFDVLADPNKVTTLGSNLPESLDHFSYPMGIYLEAGSIDSARSKFPKNGPYTIDITIFGNSFDDWGQPTNKSEEYPTVSARFTLQFSGTDGQTIVANAEKARETVQTARSRAKMYRTMPDWWSKSSNPPEPKLAPARLVPLIKGFIGQWNLTYLKHMIYEYSGPLWVIEKNSLGIPEYRMVKPYIYIMYRDPKTNTCNVGALYMRESYAGAGTYGAPYLGGIRDVEQIDCAVIK